MTAPKVTVDLDRLLKLRLIVGRHGEMDRARWWNTQGMLGPRGAVVLGRGLPRTHYFAQAHVVFAVARTRCAELFSPPGCMTLWSLPAALEDEFEERWQDWLDAIDEWRLFFEKLAELSGNSLTQELRDLGLVSPSQLDAVSKLRRPTEARALALPGVHQPNDEVLTLLAAGFAQGEPGSPVIPYARLESAP